MPASTLFDQCLEIQKQAKTFGPEWYTAWNPSPDGVTIGLVSEEARKRRNECQAKYQELKARFETLWQSVDGQVDDYIRAGRWSDDLTTKKASIKEYMDRLVNWRPEFGPFNFLLSDAVKMGLQVVGEAIAGPKDIGDADESAEKQGGQNGPADAKEPQHPTIWFHGERQYSIDRVTPLKVSEEFDSILQAFLGSQVAMETRDVECSAGVTNASRAIKNLAAWNHGIFKEAIRIANGKAKGGYFIRVKRL